MADQLYAGTARCDITPPPGIAHMNWGAQTHERAEGVDLPLWCTVLALSQGETQVLVVDLDLLQMTNEQVAVLRQAVSEMTDVPVPHVRISFTHTHSGPTLGPTWIDGGTELVPAYVESLSGRVAGTAWEALRRGRPVRVASGSGQCAININRRQVVDGRVVVGYNPEGFVDQEVGLVRLDDLDGNPVAVVVNYACHPTIMAHLNTLITPDYPGVVRRVVERTLGGTCLFLQGAAGNSGPVEGYTGDLRVYHRLGLSLGLEACRVALGLNTRPVKREFSYVQESGAPLAIYEEVPVEEPEIRLRVATHTVHLPSGACRPLEELEVEAEAARAEMTQVRETGSEADVRMAVMAAKRASQQANRARLIGGQDHLAWEVQVICIGSVVLVAIPGEPFSEIGAEVKDRSPFAQTFFSGYSNGSAWYIPTAQAFDEGGYEIGVALHRPEAAGVLAEEVVGFLKALQ